MVTPTEIFSVPGYEHVVESILGELDWRSVLSASATCTYLNDVVINSSRLQLILRPEYQGLSSHFYPDGHPGSLLERAVDIQRRWAELRPKRVDAFSHRDLYKSVATHGLLVTVHRRGGTGPRGVDNNRKQDKSTDGSANRDDDGGGYVDVQAMLEEMMFGPSDDDEASHASDNYNPGPNGGAGWTVSDMTTSREHGTAVPQTTFNTSFVFGGFAASREDNLFAAAVARNEARGARGDRVYEVVDIHLFLLLPRLNIEDKDGIVLDPIPHPGAAKSLLHFETLKYVDPVHYGQDPGVDLKLCGSVVLARVGDNGGVLGWNWRTGRKIVDAYVDFPLGHQSLLFPNNFCLDALVREEQTTNYGSQSIVRPINYDSPLFKLKDQASPGGTSVVFFQSSPSSSTTNTSESWYSLSPGASAVCLDLPPLLEQPYRPRRSYEDWSGFGRQLFFGGIGSHATESRLVVATAYLKVGFQSCHSYSTVIRLDKLQRLLIEDKDNHPKMATANQRVGLFGIKTDSLNPALLKPAPLDQWAGIADFDIWNEQVIAASSGMRIVLCKQTHFPTRSLLTLYVADYAFPAGGEVIHPWPLGSRFTPDNDHLDKNDKHKWASRNSDDPIVRVPGMTISPVRDWSRKPEDAISSNSMFGKYGGTFTRSIGRPGNVIELGFVDHFDGPVCIDADAEHVYISLSNKIIVLSF